ncbi:hypothetical protein Tco_0053639 [Tanacetum coccineum]
MSIMQNPTVVKTSDLQIELEHTKERFENCIIKKENEYAKLWDDWYKKCEECKYDKISYDKAYNVMQQKIEWLQAQLGDLKGKCKDTPCVSDTLDPLKESKVVENDKVIAPGMFRINPLKTSREDKFVPNKHVKASIRTKPITFSQPHVITKKAVNSNNKKHTSSACNNIKLVVRNDKSEVVCAMCKQCLITANHDICVLNYVYGMNSSKINQSANASKIINQTKHKAHVKKSKKLGSKEILDSPRPIRLRTCLRWLPTRRIFDFFGKLATSCNTESESDTSVYDIASTSNPQEPTTKGFPNSTSFLDRIPSPPLLLPPLHTSPTYARALLGYRAAMIQLRVASPPLPVPSPLCVLHLLFVGSQKLRASRTGSTLAHRADYGFIDTLDASIRASEGRVMTIVGEVNERVTYLATTQRQDAHEFYVRHEDAQDDRALLRAQIFLLTRERQYFRFMSLSYEREAIYARQVWSRSEDMSMALEALIRAQKDRITSLEAQTRALQRDVSVLQRQRIDNGDRLTMHIQQEHGRHRELERSRDELSPHEKPPPPMSDNAIKALVARSMADALAENEANRNSRNGDDSYEPGCG